LLQARALCFDLAVASSAAADIASARYRWVTVDPDLESRHRLQFYLAARSPSMLTATCPHLRASSTPPMIEIPVEWALSENSPNDPPDVA